MADREKLIEELAAGLAHTFYNYGRHPARREILWPETPERDGWRSVAEECLRQMQWAYDEGSPEPRLPLEGIAPQDWKP